MFTLCTKAKRVFRTLRRERALLVSLGALDPHKNTVFVLLFRVIVDQRKRRRSTAGLRKPWKKSLIWLQSLYAFCWMILSWILLWSIRPFPHLVLLRPLLLCAHFPINVHYFRQFLCTSYNSTGCTGSTSFTPPNTYQLPHQEHAKVSWQYFAGNSPIGAPQVLGDATTFPFPPLTTLYLQ